MDLRVISNESAACTGKTFMNESKEHEFMKLYHNIDIKHKGWTECSLYNTKVNEISTPRYHYTYNHFVCTAQHPVTGVPLQITDGYKSVLPIPLVE